MLRPYITFDAECIGLRGYEPHCCVVCKTDALMHAGILWPGIRNLWSGCDREAGRGLLRQWIMMSAYIPSPTVIFWAKKCSIASYCVQVRKSNPALCLFLGLLPLSLPSPGIRIRPSSPCVPQPR